MPASSAISTATISVSVVRAFFTAGSRNAPTPLLTASTPVMAVHPLAKARRSSHVEATAAAPGSAGGGATGAGEPPIIAIFTRPVRSRRRG